MMDGAAEARHLPRLLHRPPRGAAPAPRRSAPARPRLAAALLGGLGLFACSEPPPPLAGAERLLRVLGCPAGAAAAGADQGARPRVELYLDASGSMRGFVAPGAGYPRTLEELLGRLASAGYEARARALCDSDCARAEPGGARPAEAGEAGLDPRRIYAPSFYRGQRTPLAQVLSRLADSRPEQAGQEHLTLLISDLEQSTEGTDQRALVAALRRLAERRPALLLLSFLAPFQEGRRPRGAAPPPRRFYLLVVAPSAAALGELERLVLRHLPATERFQPAQVPLQIKEVRLAEQGKAGVTPPYGAYRAVEERPCGAGRGWLASFSELRPVRDGEPLQLRVSGDFRGAIESPEALQYELRRLPPPPGAATAPAPAAAPPAAPPPEVPLRPTARRDDKGDALLLTLPVPRPARRSWDLYRLRVRSGGGNLAVPPWAEAATGPAAEGKTPQLSHLVRALQQAITEEVVFLDLLLALGRGA